LYRYDAGDELRDSRDSRVGSSGFLFGDGGRGGGGGGGGGGGLGVALPPPKLAMREVEARKEAAAREEEVRLRWGPVQVELRVECSSIALESARFQPLSL
jgi:hypothetical protein